MIVEKCVHAYSSGFTTVNKDSAWHTLPMDTEVVDSDGYHDNATDNSRLTFAAGGIFLVFGNPQWINPGGGVANCLAKNGSGVAWYYTTNGNAAAPTQLTGPMTFWLEDFAAGDYMESQTLCDAGGSGSARTQMAALEVSEWSCHAGASAGQSGPVNLTFGTTVYDPHGMVTSSSVFTAQRAGYYLILTNVRGAAVTTVHKNGSGSPLNGSYAYGAGGQGVGAADYVVDWFEVGDYVEVVLASGYTVGERQFVMVWLGGTAACLGYTYDSVDLSNADAGYNGVLRTDSDFLDPCDGHPQGGYVYNPSPVYCITCGSFNMLEGYHFALAKISTNGGTFLQNDGVFTELNGSQLGNVFSTNRHASGSQETTLAFSCFEAAFGDTFTGNWEASAIYTEVAYTPYTNVFVTDTAEFPPVSAISLDVVFP